MKEIRLHGRGGQGVVKASQIVVRAAVARWQKWSVYSVFWCRAKRITSIRISEDFRGRDPSENAGI